MDVKLQVNAPLMNGIIAGVDEAGRGPLAGNVVASAVILDINHPIEGLTDSKKCSARKREILVEKIFKYARAWSVVSVSAEEIDRINILQATLLAMKQAIEKLRITPEHVFIDGNQYPDINISATAVVKGDSLINAISAASIVAKVTRDQQMIELHKNYPDYGFDQHKGYPTKAHIQALEKYGPCPAHRKSYSPVRKNLVY